MNKGTVIVTEEVAELSQHLKRVKGEIRSHRKEGAIAKLRLEEWLARHPHDRKIIGLPDLPLLIESLVKHNPRKGMPSPIFFKLAKPYNNIKRVELVVTMVRRAEPNDPNRFQFEGKLTFDMGQQMGCEYEVTGEVWFHPKIGMIQFTPKRLVH